MLRKYFQYVVLGIVIVVMVIFCYCLYIIISQGVFSSHWLRYNKAKVIFDEYGIPTISASSWENLIEAQGYVMASERLWQMDLLRRYAGGRLSEWFGENALASDIQKVKEDWQNFAKTAVYFLSPEEKLFCDSFAKGINDFILHNKYGWGLEYVILGAKPEMWKCEDTILIFMNICRDLTDSALRELNQLIWKKNLSEEWKNFLFPTFHPWSNPIFKNSIEAKNKFSIPKIYPPKDQFLKITPPSDVPDVQDLYKDEEHSRASNSWVWSNGEKTFLANDPHLNHTVPQLWFANRLRISDREWVAGVSIAGLFGVIIGFNPYLAWGFTNILEDVDDLVEETVDLKNMKYVALSVKDVPFWKPLILKKVKIHVKNKSIPIEVNVILTHRGPLVEHAFFEGKYFSRIWLAFKKGAIRLPIITLNKAKNWQEFNDAIDNLHIPTQAIVYADKNGNIGLRISGSNIKRQYSVKSVQIPKHEKGEWVDFGNSTLRPRILITDASVKQPKFIVTANSRLIDDDAIVKAEWSDDDRKHRIEQVLVSKKDFNIEDMEELQLDTKSDFHLLLLQWLIKHSSYFEKDPLAQKVKTRWTKWSGFSKDDPIVFLQALDIERTLFNLLLGRVKEYFLFNVSKIPKYEYLSARAWILECLQHPLGFRAFGFSNSDLADYLVNMIINKIYTYNKILYPSKKNNLIKISYPYFPLINKWSTQHPFYGRIFFIGNLFKIQSFEQFGYSHLIRTELPFKGANFRMVIDLKHPTNSRWIFPIGQSGHIRSKHYKDLQPLWIRNKKIPILPANFDWTF